MLNADGFDSKLMLKHEDLERNIKRRPEFEAGYSRGYWHQKPEKENEQYMEGWHKGWNDKAMDSN